MRLEKAMFALAVSSIFSISCALAADSDAVAVQSAQSFLSKVDAGAYAPAYNETATYFKKNIKQAEFVQKVGGLRQIVGKIVSRKLVTKKDLTKVPGAPDGKYVLLQYQTDFAKKKSVVETITPMLDSDGKWHVSGYYLR